jgi:hypothetical protein
MARLGGSIGRNAEKGGTSVLLSNRITSVSE